MNPRPSGMLYYVIFTATRLLQIGPISKARATPFVSVSVSVSVIRTRVRHLELHLTTISCQISDGLDLILRDITVY